MYINLIIINKLCFHSYPNTDNYR